MSAAVPYNFVRVMAALRPLAPFVTKWMFVRHRSKPNIQNPRHPHWERLKLLRVTLPIVKSEDQCGFLRKKFVQEDNPLEKILAKIMFLTLQESRLVAFYHINCISRLEMQEIRKMLFRQNIKILQTNNKITKMALQDTNYAAALSLFVSHNFVVTCAEPKLKNLLQLSKKMHHCILLAGIVDNRLLSKEELQNYAKLPNLEELHFQLSSTLSSASQMISQNLTHHQTVLSQNLLQHSSRSEEQS